VIALYSLALLVSAALLFLLEPMVGKFVLPLLGSAPEVWPTTVLFFQAALLAGWAFRARDEPAAAASAGAAAGSGWASPPSCCRSDEERCGPEPTPRCRASRTHANLRWPTDGALSRSRPEARGLRDAEARPSSEQFHVRECGV
jgi:hypothetical protein